MQILDSEAMLLADKALSVIFIILIVSLNGILILKTVRKPKFFLSPKFMLINSLAIGDIFLALFSIVVDTKLLFADTDITCVSRLTGGIYHNFVISFAFGVGVITLALELVIRYKGENMVTANRQAPVAFIFSFVPWFLVLIFVLPLTMAGIIWDTCTYPKTLFPDSRIYAMYWMCEIVPPVVAFIVSLVLMCIKLTPQQDSSNPGTTGVELGNYYHGPGSANQIHNVPVQQQHAYATTTTGKVTYQAQVNSYNVLMQNYPPQQTQYVVPTVTQPQFPKNSTNPAREKNLLLVVAIVNLVCVLPYGAFNVSESTTLSAYSLIILLHTFLWVFRLRSVLTPIIWFFDR